MYCSKCGAENPKDSKFCGNCGETIEVEFISEMETKFTKRKEVNLDYEKENLKMQQESLKVHQQQLLEQKKQFNSMAKCPRCGSTSLSGNKKGFGIGKAVVGASTLGPIGLVMGNIGAKKVRVTCLKCGKNFKA